MAGGPGSVGLMACQLARHLPGPCARVLHTSSAVFESSGLTVHRLLSIDSADHDALLDRREAR